METEQATRPTSCLYCSGPLRPGISGVEDREFANAGRFAFARCDTCRALIADPLPTDRQLGRFYERYYTHVPPSQPPRSLQRLWPLPRRRRARQAALTYFQERSGGRALEVGCGAGERLLALADQGWTVVGQDLDPRAGRLVEGRGIPLHHLPLEACDLPPGSFDLIGLSHVMEHTTRPDAMLRRCWELLAPGGRLVLLGPNADGFGRRIFGRHWQSLHVPFHVAIPGPRSAELLARRLGLPPGEGTTRATDADVVASKSAEAPLGARLPAPALYPARLAVGIAMQACSTIALALRPATGVEVVWTLTREPGPQRPADPAAAVASTAVR